MTTAEVLRRAAELIEPEGAWTRRAFARDAKGDEVPTLDASAVCWCARGAIIRVAGWTPEGDKAYRALLKVVPPIKRGEPVAHWQDNRNRKQATVVKALRDAADALDAKKNSPRPASESPGVSHA